MKNYPLIRFVIILIVGIIAQSVLQISITALLISLLFLITFALFLPLIKNDNTDLFRQLFIGMSILIFGALYYGIFNSEKTEYPFPEPKFSHARIEGTIEKIDLRREGRINLVVSSDSITLKDKPENRKYSFLCAIYDDGRKTDKLFNNIYVGNHVLINGIVQRPRDERNPGEFDYEKYLNNKGVVALLNVYSVDSLKITSREISFLKNAVFIIRKSIDEKISELHNKTTRALLRGLLLADRSMIDDQINDYFINAGVVHVLCVSGLHVGYIVLIFLVLFNRFNIYTRYILTFTGLFFFLIVTGAAAPVFRSTIMAMVLLFSPLTGRDYNSLNSLSLAALIILMINPNELMNPGFQLSFSAILSLIIIYPPLKKIINNLNIKPKPVKWIALFCATSISAQLGTLPFTLTYFHRLSLSSLLANLIVIPSIGAIVALGIITLAAGSISVLIGSVFASANELIIFIIYKIVQILGGNNYSHLTINQFSVYDAIIFYLIIGQIFYIIKKFIAPSAKIIAVSGSVILLFILMRVDNYNMMPMNKLSVAAIDVGQGDSFLIRFPDMQTALIDAGDKTDYFDNGSRVIIPLLDKLEIDTLDYAFVSHVDSDHYKGMEALINAHRIKTIYKPALDTSSQSDLEFENLLRKMNYQPRYYSREIITIGKSRIYVLNDTINNYFETPNSNDKSGMLKLVAGKTSILFTGDAGVNAEEKYLNRYGSFLRANVLKIGHHGSRSSTGDKFLDAVNPEIALISAGIANKFHHPNKIILDKLNAKQIAILRTDKSGAILLQSDGRKFSRINWKDMESNFNY